MSSSPAIAREMSWVTSKACQRLLGQNAVTAQVRLAKYDIKGSPGFSIFVPGDLHANNLGDFLAVRYNSLYSFYKGLGHQMNGLLKTNYIISSLSYMRR